MSSIERQAILDLVEDGTVVVLTGGAFALAPSGRPADPHAKPPPAPPAETTTRMRTIKKPPPAPPKKPAAKLAITPPKHNPGRPWPPPAALMVAPATEEYDPVTGEVRAVAARPIPAVGTPSKGVPVTHTAPVKETDPRVTGRITVHPAGYGFVNTDDGETVFVPAKYRNHSLDGARVIVDTWPGVRGTEGRVKEVLARGRARLTGLLRRVGRAVYLEPDDPRIAADYGRVHLDAAPMGKDGAALVVEITRYPAAARREMAAKLLKVLGDPEAPRTEIEKILAVSLLPLEFPDEAEVQAEQPPSELGPADFATRITLRRSRITTIVPQTTTDY